ncbi:hypothetical protein, partial [Pontibacter beigongshangensis]|uniref:hypothetical protein n=1 Tax=Pontibacter beigongshangensis TaxID=2574733 RepID=UPI001650A1D3
KLTVIIAISFFACQKQTDKSAQQTKADLAQVESVAAKTESQKSPIFHSDSPLGTELKNALDDPSTDKYFVEVFNKVRIVKHPDDDKMLSVTDSLFSKDPSKDFFYFIVFTKSLNGADGFYSEAAGVKGTEFLTTKTESFADYFNIGPKLDDTDMRNWASSIVGEIQIEREGEEAMAINELESQLRKNIKYSRKEYSLVIEKFIGYIKKVQKERITSH